MTTLQIVWFLLIAVLFTGYAVLDGFDFGVGIWHLFTNKQRERKILLNTIRPMWDGNEVWLITGGGALFAAFPPVYATIFSGLYIPLMLVLLGLIIRIAGIDFRDKVNSTKWKHYFDYAFAIGSILPALLFSVALGNLLKGMELNYNGDYVGGFFALLNPYSLHFGITGVVMFAVHGANFIALKTTDSLQTKAIHWGRKTIPIYFGLSGLMITWTVVSYPRDYILLSIILGIIGEIFVGLNYILLKAHKYYKAFLASSASIIMFMSAAAANLFPFLVPGTKESTIAGLDIFTSSSSERTLRIMLIITLLGMPIVIGYTIFIYKIFAGKVHEHSLD